VNKNNGKPLEENDENCIELLTKIRVRSKSPLDKRDEKVTNLLYDIDIDEEDLNNGQILMPEIIDTKKHFSPTAAEEHLIDPTFDQLQDGETIHFLSTPEQPITSMPVSRVLTPLRSPHGT